MMLNRQLLQALQHAQQRSDRPLVEFKAGRLLPRDGMLVPERTKGKIVLVFEDHLMHFQWKDRENSDRIPDGMDIILFPGDAKFGRVKNVDKGRVFVLKFNNSDRQEFFWMQEAEDDKDEEHMRKINQHINNPPARPSGAREDVLSGLFGSVSSSQRQQQESQQQQRHEVQLDRLQDILRGIAPQQPQQQQPPQQQPPQQQPDQSEEQPQEPQQHGEQGEQPQEAPSSAASTSASEVATSQQGEGALTQEQQLQLFQQLQQLQNQYAQQQHQQSSLEGPFLQHILNTDTVCHALMKHPEIATELAQYLPDGTASDVESVCEHIRSAQFQSAVSMFNHALMTGEIQPFLESFGLPRATGAGVEAFVRDVQNQANQQSEEQQGDQEGKGSGDSMDQSND